MTDPSTPSVRRSAVLVHEDAEMRTAYREMLESLGFDVVEAEPTPASLHEALAAPPFDLAVVEAYGRQAEPLAVIDELRGRQPNLPLVVLSTFGEDESLAGRVEREDLVVLQAPFTLDALKNAVSARVGESRPASPPGKPDPRRNRLFLVVPLAAALLAAVLTFSRTSPPPLPPISAPAVTRGAQLDLLLP